VPIPPWNPKFVACKGTCRKTKFRKMKDEY
jgi:hypothetical protein